MTVVAKAVSKKQYEIPPEGLVWATLVEIRDLGLVTTGAYGQKPKVLFVWETDCRASDGMPIRVYERLGNTLHAMGRLAPRIKSITGEMPDPAADYNLSMLEGTRAQLVIAHNQSDDGKTTYANISTVIRQKTAEDKAWDRKMEGVNAAVKARPPVKANGTAITPDDPVTDADVPF